VVGYCLGGGFGWLSRMKGMAVDNVVSIVLVLADGNIVNTCPNSNSELFWGLCGGGRCTFGVVTEITLKLHRIQPVYFAGSILWVNIDIYRLLTVFNTIMSTVPKQLTIYLYITGHIVYLNYFYDGPAEDGDKIVTPILDKVITQFGVPQQDSRNINEENTKTWCYTKWQNRHWTNRSDRKYWRSGFLTEIPLNAISIISSKMKEKWNSQNLQHLAIGFEMLGGAISEITNDHACFHHRSANLIMTIQPNWPFVTEEDSNRFILWADDFAEKMKPFFFGCYANYTEASDAFLSLNFGAEKTQRLHILKNKYDPHGIFPIHC